MTAPRFVPGRSAHSAGRHHSEVRRRHVVPVALGAEPPAFAPTELDLDVEDGDEPATLIRRSPPPGLAVPVLPRAVSEAVAVAAAAAVSSVPRRTGTPRWLLPGFLVVLAVLGDILGAVAARVL
jgi:hypothetical protein